MLAEDTLLGALRGQMQHAWMPTLVVHNYSPCALIQTAKIMANGLSQRTKALELVKGHAQRATKGEGAHSFTQGDKTPHTRTKPHTRLTSRTVKQHGSDNANCAGRTVHTAQVAQ